MHPLRHSDLSGFTSIRQFGPFGDESIPQSVDIMTCRVHGFHNDGFTRVSDLNNSFCISMVYSERLTRTLVPKSA